MVKMQSASADRLADEFVSYPFENYQDHRHVRRVASWIGLIVLGIAKVADDWKIPRTRQLERSQARRVGLRACIFSSPRLDHRSWHLPYLLPAQVWPLAGGKLVNVGELPYVVSTTTERAVLLLHNYDQSPATRSGVTMFPLLAHDRPGGDVLAAHPGIALNGGRRAHRNDPCRRRVTSAPAQ